MQTALQHTGGRFCILRLLDYLTTRRCDDPQNHPRHRVPVPPLMTHPVVIRIPPAIVVQDERTPRRPTIQPVAPYRRRLMTRRTANVPHPTRTGRRVVPPRHSNRPITTIPVIGTTPPPATIRVLPVIADHDDIRTWIANDHRIPATGTAHQHHNGNTKQTSAHATTPFKAHVCAVQIPCVSASCAHTITYAAERLAFWTPDRLLERTVARPGRPSPCLTCRFPYFPGEPDPLGAGGPPPAVNSDLAAVRVQHTFRQSSDPIPPHRLGSNVPEKGKRRGSYSRGPFRSHISWFG
jgi:hypothetical protein